MHRTFLILKTIVTLILAIAGIVFVLGMTDPETRWSKRSLVVLGFSAIFILYCVWILVRLFRKDPEK